MTAYPIPNPFSQWVGITGLPLTGAKIYIGEPNQDPETHPIAVYQDAALTIGLAQPIRTNGGYLSGTGTPINAFPSSTPYSIRVRTSAGVEVFYRAEVHDEIADFLALILGTSGAGRVGFSQSETYPASTVGLHNQLIVSPGDAPWLAAGDGSTNDTSAWLAMMGALQARGGGHVICKAGATYKVTQQIDVYDNISIDLNGATVNHAFATGSNYAGFLMHNNTKLFGGTTAMGTGTPGSPSGQYFCNIVTGISAATPLGYNNIQIHDLTITNLRADTIGGTGVMVFGGSTNVDVYNIYTPSSSTLAAAVRVTWCGDGGSPSPAVSAHPGNVRVSNIRGGTMTKATNGTGDVAFVDLVGCYDTTVDNVIVDAFAGDSVFQVRAGAFGSAIAPVAVQKRFLKGIKARGISCSNATNRLILVNGRSHGAGPIPEAIYGIPAIIDTCSSVGAAASCLQAGVECTYVSQTIFRNIEISDHFRGIFVQEQAANLLFEDCKTYENQHEGVTIANGTTPPEDITVRRCESYSNGQSGSDAKGFYTESALRVTFDDCTAGSSGEATQLVGFAIAANSTDVLFLGRNRVRAVAAGGVTYDFAVPVYGSVKFNGGTNAALSTAAPDFSPLVGTGKTAADTDASVLMQPILLTNFRIKYVTAPGGATARQCKIVAAGVGTQLDVTTTGASTLSASFKAVAIAADSVVYVQHSIAAGVPAASRAQWSCEGILI